VPDKLITTLASYVPALIKHRLAADPTPIDAPRSDNFPAAVLYADISGFTALTERLAHHGPAGAEELTSLLNTYFGRLIRHITDHGGDVVKFAGDALIALWPATDDRQLRQAVHRAAQCALVVQRQLNNFDAGAGIRLSLRLTLGAGQMLTMHLGGVYNRWEFLVAGEPLVEVGDVEHLANPGDIFLTPPAWDLLRDVAVGQAMSRNNISGVRLHRLTTAPPAEPLALPPLSKTMADGLKTYIPGAILARLAAGQRGWLAELRRITVLFVNLSALDYGMPLEQAQTVMRTLQTAIYRYEGSINKLSVDDKGVTLIAGFGLPPLAHEDDAIRGVQAALDIHAELRELGLQSAIGVTTGRAFCGTVGNDVRREYTMIGDVVNLSARLMQAAENTILCDGATYQAVQNSAALELLLGVDLDGSGAVGDVPYFEELSPILVKGKSAPVPVYRPRHQGRMTVDPHLFQTPLVGRTAEQLLLTEKLQALHRERSGSVLLIEGEAGMGKSQLVSEILQQARVLNVTTLVGAGSAIEKSTPYHAWRPVFKQFFKLDELPDDPEVRRAAVLEKVEQLCHGQPLPGSSATAAELAPLLDAVLPLDWSDNELTAQMSGKVRADNTHNLLVCLLRQTVSRRGAVEPPILLVLEDARWLDSASWGLARLVAAQVSALMMVLATRPLLAPVPDDYTRLLALPHAQKVQLGHLAQEEVAALIRQRLGVSHLPAALSRLVYEKAEGNPFFTEELVYALRDSGLITVTHDRCTLSQKTADPQALRLPDTIQGIITSRIDRLTPSQQLTLKVASVIGRAFEYVTLHDVHPIDIEKPHLSDYLNTLDKMDITQIDQPEPNLAYIFKQTITQEVAYNMMLFAQRRELHQAVARWFEKTYADDLSPHYAVLAYHWRRANVIPKATEYLEKAGDEALKTFANEEAVEFFSQALQLAESAAESDDHPPVATPRQRARWEMKLGQAYVNWVRFSDGQAHLEQGLALLGYPVPRSNPGLIVGLAWEVARQFVWWLLPKFSLRKQVDRAALREASQAYDGLTAVYYFAGETLLSLYAAFRSLNLAEKLGPSPELARGSTAVGAIIGFVPVHRVAQTYCYRAVNMTRKFDDMPAKMWVWLGTGMYYAGVGNWPRAAHLFEQIIDAADRLGDRYRWDDGVGNLAVVKYFQGDLPASAQLWQDTLASARRRNDVHNQAWALRGVVYCLLPQGKFDEAFSALENLQHLLAQDTHIVDEALRIDLYGLLALVQAQRGHLPQADEAARAAFELIAKNMPTSYLSLPGYAGLAEMFLNRWESELAAGLNIEIYQLPVTPQARGHRSTFTRPARRACGALKKYARVFPVGRARANLLQGRFEWLSGRPRLARELWRISLEAARQLDMPLEAALAHFETGRHLPPEHPERAQHLHRAAEFFEQAGAEFHLQQVKEAIQCTTHP